MAGLERLRGEPEALAREPLQERVREQAVVAAGEHARRDLGPGVQRPRVLERPVGLPRLAARERLVHHFLRDVVEEALHDVERGVGIAALAKLLLAPRFGLAGGRPPLARRLARRGDHRGDEDDLGGVDARQRALKAAIDCATRITPERSPAASVTVAA